MKITEILKKAISVLCSAVIITGTSAACGASDLIDLDMDCSTIPALEPWVNFAFGFDHYDATKFTADTEIIVTYSHEFIAAENDIEGEEEEYRSECPVEIILQSWSNPDTPMVNATGGVWAKVAPYEWGDGVAKFNMSDMITAYGIEDFSGVDSINVGATAHAVLTVTSFKITNCEEDIYIAMTDAERAEAYKNALIAVLAGALVLIIGIIVVFMIILKRKTGYAYDASTGKYVKIEKKK